MIAIYLYVRNIVNVLKQAINEASKSSFNHRVGAVLMKNNHALASGFNQLRHQGTIKTSHWKGSLHAEVACLIDALRKVPKSKIRGTTLVVVRLKRDGTLGLAFPCKDCYDLIESFGIKRVIFSTNTGVSEIKI